MSDREPTNRELEEILREIGAAAEYPPTPDVSGSVRSRLESEASRPLRRRRWFESPGVRVAAALVVVLVLAIPVVPLLREDVTSSGGSASQSESEGMQAGGGEVERAPLPPSSAEPDLPDSAAGGVRDSSRTDFGGILDLTEEITPERSRDISGGSLPRIRMNGAVIEPDELYASGDSVVAVYGEQPGLPQMGETGIGAAIYSRPGGDISAYLEREVEGEDYRRVGDKYWFPDGGDLRSEIGDTDDLSGGALLWMSGDRVLILRSSLPETRAIEVSETIR